MAQTETYVDPSIAGNSGTGSKGDPYGDLQYALDTMTRDAVNGDRINIKAGTDEVLATKSLDLTSYGIPTDVTPLTFQGYTTDAGDGGIGGIDGDATYSIMGGDTYDYIVFKDMHLHNTGANDILSLDNGIVVENCELNNTSARAIDVDATCFIANNYIHDVGSAGIFTAGGTVIGNFLKNGAVNKFTFAIIHQGTTTNNIISIDGTSVGIDVNASTASVVGNSIYSDGGSGTGILADQDCSRVTNNIVEGFSNGGVGIDTSNATRWVLLYGKNYVTNCTTAYDEGAVYYINLGNTEVVNTSVFTDPSSDDFSIDTTATVKAVAYPTYIGEQEGTNQNFLDVGAVQREEPSAVVPVITNQATSDKSISTLESTIFTMDVTNSPTSTFVTVNGQTFEMTLSSGTTYTSGAVTGQQIGVVSNATITFTATTSSGGDEETLTGANGQTVTAPADKTDTLITEMLATLNGDGYNNVTLTLLTEKEVSDGGDLRSMINIVSTEAGTVEHVDEIRNSLENGQSGWTNVSQALEVHAINSTIDGTVTIIYNVDHS